VKKFFFPAAGLMVMLLFCGVTMSCPPETTEIEVLEYGDLVFEENFESDPIDSGKWNFEYGDGSQYGSGLWGWGNNEKQYYTRDNVYVQNGILYIEAKKENKGGMDYTSARITTSRAWTEDGEIQPLRFKVSKGKVEARIKSPRGSGFWPAFWLIGADSFNDGEKVVPWPRCGELDILEIKGNVPNRVHSTIHFGERYSDRYWYTGGHYDHNASLADDFHVYGVVWDEEAMSFLFDDVVFHTIYLDRLEGGDMAHPETFTDEAGFGINLNLAIGGNFIGGRLPPDSVFDGPPEDRCLMVDWVRVYK
jgi:beta-glucanase (GH16 family)